jgi:hypothetical protein
MVKFVVKKEGPKTRVIEVALLQEFDGVSLMVGDYYICTLKNAGFLKLHRDVHHPDVETDSAGRVTVTKEGDE